jgi:rod shape determining protein RodA
MRKSLSTNWRHFDFWLLGAVAVLTIFGITMIRSAVAGNIESADSATNQLIFAVVGFTALLFIASIDYRVWASWNSLLYVGIITVLLGLKLVGGQVFGSTRWFQIGPINIQPSEFAKIVIILALANYFSRNQEQMGEMRPILRSLVLTLGITTFVLLQPNLSTTIVMVVVWFSLLWAAGLRIKHLLIFIGSGLAGAIVGLPLLYRLGVIQDYQIGRVTSFLFPDPNASYGDTYNIEQALIAIGSGGWFGQGYGQGSQVQGHFLKVRWSDFIFSAMAQEFGFVGTTLVLLLFIFVIFRCLRAARMARDTYGALIAYGVAVVLVFQGMVNVGVNLKLLPATGLTLPFVSYGGSSLLSALLCIGLVESVILRHKALEFAPGNKEGKQA